MYLIDGIYDPQHTSALLLCGVPHIVGSKLCTVLLGSTNVLTAPTFLFQVVAQNRFKSRNFRTAIVVPLKHTGPCPLELTGELLQNRQCGQ